MEVVRLGLLGGIRGEFCKSSVAYSCRRAGAALRGDYGVLCPEGEKERCNLAACGATDRQIDGRYDARYDAKLLCE